MSSLKCKQKHCGFPEDKNSNKKSFDSRISEKIGQSDPRKDKINPRIAICKPKGTQNVPKN